MNPLTFPCKVNSLGGRWSIPVNIPLRLLWGLHRLREQPPTPPRSVIIVISFSWCTSLSTSRGGKSTIIYVFLSFIYWAQKLRKYTVSIELNWNITLFLFHGVIQFSINQITYQYLKHKCIIFFHFRLSRWGSGPP